MFDLNAILSAAIGVAIAEATKPLHEAVQTLSARIAALENNPAVGVDTTLAARVDALEKTGNFLTADSFIFHLDNQEWFWEKLTRKAAEIADAAAEEAIDRHCSDYDHDDYDRTSSAVNEIDLDSIVTQDNLLDEIKDVLSKASFDVRI